MLEELKEILNIQELDMKMIRLMRVKKERMKELQHIEELRKELHQQTAVKETEIEELGKNRFSSCFGVPITVSGEKLILRNF